MKRILILNGQAVVGKILNKNTYPEAFIGETVNNRIGKAVGHGQPMTTDKETSESLVRD